jgi:hypothetical protein
MILRLIIAGFFTFIVLSNYKRLFKFVSYFPSNIKSIFIIWNLIMSIAWIGLIGYILSLNKYFIYLFPAVFPISGVFAIIFPSQMSTVIRIVGGKLPEDPVFEKVNTEISKVKPNLPADSVKSMNFFNTPKGIRIFGSIFVIFGGIFLYIMINSFN